MSFLSKFKGAASGATNPGIASPLGRGKKDKEEPEPEITPLQKMLQNAGPLRADGSDKFFGMENFGNTCYCNSIVQALYYSTPFRENVVRYPPHSPHDTPNGNRPPIVTPIRAPVQNGAAAATKAKGISAAEAMKRRAAINAGQPVPAPPGQRPEDKPDSPEYKKKHAMLAGPILDLTYENAASYGMEESTFTALKDIFMAMIANSSRTGVLSPQRFLEIFKRDNEMFRTSMHQDAHEFYGLVLNAVISNVEANAQRMKELEPSGSDAVSALKSAAMAMGLNSGMRSPGTGWVHDIFEGVLTSETKCLTCETASQRDETFLDLSIDLEEHSSVTSCLRKFSAEEMLCERNKFHCDNCGGLQEAEKRMKIKKLPKILTLHLKRFKYTEDMTRLQKLFHRVVYPYHLRMFNTTDDAEDPDRLYELYAIVVHIGSNAYHGHYVSVIKTQDRGWLLFDDEMVEPVDKHYVKNFFGDKPGQACAYVLFYQETTVEAMKREQEAEGLAEATLATEVADVALHRSQTNGLSKHISTPTTPVDDNQEYVSLDHTVSSPLPLSARAVPPPAPVPSLQQAPVIAAAKPKSKQDKEREKKELKEAEKARKQADKDRVKAEEQRRKEVAVTRREEQKKQDEDLKKAIAASKQSTTEDEQKRNAGEGSSSTTAAANGNGNGVVVQNGHADPAPKSEKPLFGSLSRSHTGGKSMSRKSFGFLGGKKPSEAREDSSSSNTAVDGEPGPQTPEKHAKSTKDRFSFSGLGRKKSSLMS